MSRRNRKFSTQQPQGDQDYFNNNLGEGSKKQKKEVPQDGVKRNFVDSYNEFEFFKPSPKVGTVHECTVMFLSNMWTDAQSPSSEDIAVTRNYWCRVNGERRSFKTNKLVKKAKVVKNGNAIEVPLMFGDLDRYKYKKEFIPQEELKAKLEELEANYLPKTRYVLDEDGNKVTNAHKGGMYCPTYGVGSMLYSKLSNVDQRGEDDFCKLNSPKRFVWVYILEDETVNNAGKKVFEGRIMPMLINGKTVKALDEIARKGFDLFSTFCGYALTFTYDASNSMENSNCEVSISDEMEMIGSYVNSEGELVNFTDGFDAATLAEVKEYLEECSEVSQKNVKLEKKKLKNPDDNIVLKDYPEESEAMTTLLDAADARLKEIQGYDFVEHYGNPSEIHPLEAIRMVELLLDHIVLEIDNPENKAATERNILKFYLPERHDYIKSAMALIREGVEREDALKEAREKHLNKITEKDKEEHKEAKETNVTQTSMPEPPPFTETRPLIIADDEDDLPF